MYGRAYREICPYFCQVTPDSFRLATSVLAKKIRLTRRWTNYV